MFACRQIAENKREQAKSQRSSFLGLQNPNLTETEGKETESIEFKAAKPIAGSSGVAMSKVAFEIST